MNHIGILRQLLFHIVMMESRVYKACDIRALFGQQTHDVIRKPAAMTQRMLPEIIEACIEIGKFPIVFSDNLLHQRLQLL